MSGRVGWRIGGILLAVWGAAALVVAQTALSRLGMAESDGHEAFMSAIVGVGGPGTAAKPFLALSPTVRATTVTDLVGWAKGYAASPAFKAAWAAKRDQHKPTPPVVAGTVDDELKKQDADQQKQIDDMQKGVAALPPDQRTALQATIAQITTQYAASAKDPNMVAMRRQGIQADRAQKQQQYSAELTRWQADYPVDPMDEVARRLHDFLTLSAAVNFDAKLVTRNGRQVFADDQLEHQSPQWKMCFRAGREATAAARQAAAQWLKELGK